MWMFIAGMVAGGVLMLLGIICLMDKEQKK